MGLILKVAAGILLAGFISLGLRLAYVNHTAHMAQQAMQEQIERQKERRAMLERQRKEQAQLKRQRELMAAQRAKEKAAENALKLKAWFQYYEAPEGCHTFKSDQHMVECVSHKKRARQEFDRLYSQGQITATQNS